MAKMSTYTKFLVVAAVGTGVYFIARSVKAKAKKVEEKKKKLTTGELPGNGNGKKPGIPKAPPYPAEKAADETVWIDEVFTPWAAQYAEEDAALVQSGEVDPIELAGDLTDAAFEMAYPSWGDSQFPNNWQQSTEWTKWADAWNRMHKQMVDLVSQALSEYGV